MALPSQPTAVSSRPAPACWRRELDAALRAREIAIVLNGWPNLPHPTFRALQRSL
jgi:hypothetical protein